MLADEILYRRCALSGELTTPHMLAPLGAAATHAQARILRMRHRHRITRDKCVLPCHAMRVADCLTGNRYSLPPLSSHHGDARRMRLSSHAVCRNPTSIALVCLTLPRPLLPLSPSSPRCAKPQHRHKACSSRGLPLSWSPNPPPPASPLLSLCPLSLRQSRYAGL